MRNKINEYLHAYEQQGYFSGTVLVARNGEIILNEGYGLSNREHDVKNTSSTIYQLASISKMFTAAAVMLLHEQGIMDVDRPIHYYLPEFPNGDRMTGHHLLTHTSGLSKPIGLNAKMKIKLEDVIQKFSDQPLAFDPGEKFKYVNSGYILLTYLIEKLSGQAFEDFLKQHIFLPSGMNNTGYDTDKRILKNRASGYSAFKNQIINGEFMDMSTHAGAAGLYSTAYDLFLWDQALNAGKLLNQDSLKRVFTPHQKTYGYGWYIDPQMIGGAARQRALHGGLSDCGFFTRITKFPEERLFIVTLSNFLLSPLEKINQDLAAMLFGEAVSFPEQRQEQLPAKPLDYNKFEGMYEAFMPIPVTLEQGRLYITIFGFKLELFFYCESEEQIDFHAKVADVRVSFHTSESGKATGATIYWLGEDGYEAKRKG